MVALKYRENDEAIIRELDKFDGDYLPLDKDRLVLFSVSFLESKKIEPTFDKIVVTTFKLFPKKFSLIGFPEYPDSNVIRECLHLHCTKSKKWLTGNLRSAYKINDKGRYFLDETKKMLEGKIKITKTYGVVPKRKEVTFINKLKKTDAFKRFIENKKEGITQSKILEAIMLSPNSEELIESRIKKYLEYANRINEPFVVEFLEFINRKVGDNKNA